MPCQIILNSIKSLLVLPHKFLFSTMSLPVPMSTSEWWKDLLMSRLSSWGCPSLELGSSGFLLFAKLSVTLHKELISLYYLTLSGYWTWFPSQISYGNRQLRELLKGLVISLPALHSRLSIYSISKHWLSRNLFVFYVFDWSISFSCGIAP